MVNYAKFTLSVLSVLSSLSLARASPYVWQVTNLQASDAPLDPSQTGATPAQHHIEFDITDQQQQATFACAASWANSDIPNYVQQCAPVSGNTADQTFQFAVQNYYSSAAGGFEIAVTELSRVAGVDLQYSGTIRESNGVGGGSCTYAELPNMRWITFPSCTWPAINVEATSVTP